MIGSTSEDVSHGASSTEFSPGAVLSGADIQALLAQGMGTELHWFPADVTASRLAAVLVGMANTTGGTVLVGVSPRLGQVQGIGDIVQASDMVFQAALLTDPPLVLPMPQIRRVNQPRFSELPSPQNTPAGTERRMILWVTVPPGLPNVYSLDGRYLGREGSQTNPLSARRLRQLLLERGVVLFEAQIPPLATLDDLDPQKVEAYVRALNLPGSTSYATQGLWEETLLRRGCLRRDERKLEAGKEPESLPLLPTYAAVLLFGKHPQQWLPNATILAARFTGITLADRYVKQDIAGTLPDQIRQVEAFVQENMRSVVRLVGFTHQETAEYPLEAVRELVVNAIAHRDYNIQGDNIHINIFADRIEIHSPGGLPGPMTLQNLLEARFSRNAVITQVLSDLGYVERLGYGLNRVVEVVRQSHLRLPRFEEVAGSFRVTMFGDADALQASSLPDLSAYQDLDLNSRQQAALDFLVRHRRITNRDYQELCPDVHSETLRRDLADLVNRGLVIKVGDKRATYYILKK